MDIALHKYFLEKVVVFLHFFVNYCPVLSTGKRSAHRDKNKRKARRSVSLVCVREGCNCTAQCVVVFSKSIFNMDTF